jgi:hypothetical protein
LSRNTRVPIAPALIPILTHALQTVLIGTG